MEREARVAGRFGRVRRAYRAEALKASRQPTLLAFAVVVVLATFLTGWVEASRDTGPENGAGNGVAAEDVDIFDTPGASDNEAGPAAGESRPNAFPIFASAARTGMLVASLLILLFSANLLAGEATGGTFRLILVRPVTKTDVIFAKWLLVVAAVVVFTLLTAATAWLTGLLFGTYADVDPYTTTELAERAVVCMGVTPLGLIGFAGLGLLLSSIFQNSAGSVTAATLVGIGVFALNLFLTEAEQLLNLSTYTFRYLDMLESWTGGESSYAFTVRQIRPALVVAPAYALAFLLGARIIFGRRDIHS